MRIQHNIMAMNSYRNLSANNKALSKNLEKLSSGYKINRAGDDAAGLAISEKMRAQITGLEKAQSNANDGISLVQTAEGALTEVHDMLNRMYELAEQSANGTYDDDVDRDNIQKEVTALSKEINRIAKASNFNGINLLDGTQGVTEFADGGDKLTVTMTEGTSASAAKVEVDFANVDITKLNAGDKGTVKLNIGGTTIESTDLQFATTGKVTATSIATAFNGKKFELDGKTYTAAASGGKVTFTADKAGVTKLKDGVEASTTLEGGGGLDLQIGDTADDYNKLSVGIKSIDTFSLDIAQIKVSDQASASSAMSTIKDAINTVSSIRGNLGALQNRLDHTINNLSVMQENIQDAESAIRDTDVADEMMAYTKNNILIQSAQAMLAQANQVPQGVLQLMQ